MSRQTLLITGGSSYLGRHLTVRAAQKFIVYSTYYHHAGRVTAGHAVPLDLTNPTAVLQTIEKLAPQAVIHAAAINPGGDDRQMMRVNSDGSRAVAEAAGAVGARLVHISTDVVHSGRHAPYDDEALPTPINLYGRSKAAAEAAVANVNSEAAIVRTSLIYGLAEMDRGSAGFVKRVESGQPLVLFDDVIRQPVWVETLNEALLKLINLNFAGIVNVVGWQALTRAAFGRKMLAYWGLDHDDLVQSGRAADISETIPLDLRMSVVKGEKLLHMRFPGVDEVLARHQPPSSH